MFKLFGFGGGESSSPEQIEGDLVERAKEAVAKARVAPDVYKNADEEDTTLRQAVIAASLNPRIKYLDINASPAEIEELFGRDIRLNFDAKEEELQNVA